VGVPKARDKSGQRIQGKGAVRRAAGYASKYVGKAYEDRSAGGHRYECAQGFQPVSLEIRAEQLTTFRGVPSAWSSTEGEGWPGPPSHMWGSEGEGEELNMRHGRTELVGARV